MGVVVGAQHLRLDRPIAIKLMSPLFLYSEGSVERFVQEARLAARIQSEHVVRVFDVASLDDGTPYIVMEYLEGEDLRLHLLRRGHFPVAEAVDYILQASESIAEAHVEGVVHRDLKPGNLFASTRLDGSTLVKVLDFGVSKLLHRADLTRNDVPSTGPHVIMGSPLYSSPEQLRASKDVDARSDIWSLGAILYEFVAGKPPFGGATLVEICTSVMNSSPPPLAAMRPEVPRELDAVIEKSLAKEREERFRSMAEFARALAPFATGASLISIGRIERVLARVAGPGWPADAPTMHPGSLTNEPCETTLPARLVPRAGTGSRRTQWTHALKHAGAPAALVTVASLLMAGTAALVVANRHSIAGSGEARGTATTFAAIAPATTAPVAAAAASASAAASAPDRAIPSAPAASAPSVESSTPADRTGRATRTTTRSAPKRPPFDTSEFGGLE
jgi:serine/threonine-protein kinase